MPVLVRLEPADMAAMARRANSFLAPEGAQAWYSNDIPKLLEEIAELRKEQHEARDCFGDQTDDPLPVVAQRWQETSTGIWEKAQVKKLRQEIGQLKAELDIASAKLVQAQETILAKTDSNGKLVAELASVGERLQNVKANHAVQVQQEADKRIELEQRLALADAEIKRLAGLSERNTQILTAQAQELKAEVREALQRALELVG